MVRARQIFCSQHLRTRGGRCCEQKGRGGADLAAVSSPSSLMRRRGLSLRPRAESAAHTVWGARGDGKHGVGLVNLVSTVGGCTQEALAAGAASPPPDCFPYPSPYCTLPLLTTGKRRVRQVDLGTGPGVAGALRSPAALDAARGARLRSVRGAGRRPRRRRPLRGRRLPRL